MVIELKFRCPGCQQLLTVDDEDDSGETVTYTCFCSNAGCPVGQVSIDVRASCADVDEGSLALLLGLRRSEAVFQDIAGAV